MTLDQRSLLSEALRDLDVLRVDTPQLELLNRARDNIAAAMGQKPVRFNEMSDTWPDFVEGDL